MMIDKKRETNTLYIRKEDLILSMTPTLISWKAKGFAFHPFNQPLSEEYDNQKFKNIYIKKKWQKFSQATINPQPF